MIMIIVLKGALPLAGSKDLCRILTELQEAVNEWKDIGLFLDVRYHVTKEIEERYPSNKDRLAEVIDRWLKTGCSELSWKNLCAALCSDLVNQTVLAKRLEKKYCN